MLQEAGAAMGLNGQTLGDRALKVENAKSARETTPQGAANPYTAMQLQQMQQLQMQQMQSASLAAQVCSPGHPSAVVIAAHVRNAAASLVCIAFVCAKCCLLKSMVTAQDVLFMRPMSAGRPLQAYKCVVHVHIEATSANMAAAQQQAL